MTILIAGNNNIMLDKLALDLAGIYPDSKIVALQDALMAGKYAFSNKVDILITEINMKRMNGLQLIEFAKHGKADVQTYLVETRSEFADSPAVIPEDATGMLLYPYTQQSLREMLRR